MTAQTMPTLYPTRRGSPTIAVLHAESRLFGRELGSLFYILLFPVVLLSILGAIPSFREDSADLGGMSVVDLYVPVTVLLSMIMAALMAMPSIVLAYREAGVLRRLRTTPVRPASILVVQVLLHAATVAGSSILLLTVGRLVFGTPLPQSWPGYIGAYVLALVASFSLGAAITAISPMPGWPPSWDPSRSSDRCSPQGCTSRCRRWKDCSAESSSSPRSVPHRRR
ncbi:ABC transporter permease [Brachybacterium sp. Z12]|uniref:ABC transporter permease n=1 Tax=Brachybacterium sp. Z12 TaxID=2759167 RepID=UPI00223B3A50|nr:ABC transporter permease [Brachybacterium sp. Z12]